MQKYISFVSMLSVLSCHVATNFLLQKMRYLIALKIPLYKHGNNQPLPYITQCNK